MNQIFKRWKLKESYFNKSCSTKKGERGSGALILNEMFKLSKKLLMQLRSLSMKIYKKYSLPRWLVFIIDISVILLAFFAACLLRFNFDTRAIIFHEVLRQAYLAMATYGLANYLFRAYAGLIRHTTINDITRLFTANISAFSLLFIISLTGRELGWNKFFVIPYSILIIHFILVTVIHSLIRVLIKLSFESVSRHNREKKNVIIFGAGGMGVITEKIISNDHESNLAIKGFIDDARKMWGKSVNGHPVWSPAGFTTKLVERENIKTLIIAINKIPAKRKSEVIKMGLDLGLEVLEVPDMQNWLQGKLDLRQLQRVKAEDLLGRNPIELNTGRIQKGLDGMKVMVTGAAGSIGSEIVRQLAKFRSVTMILVDQAETPVYYLKYELEKEFPGIPAKVIIADVTRRRKMEKIFEEYRPDIVFHAAAYKHVPLMEENPHEAVRVNVGGTKCVAELAVQYGVKKFIMISSDKAVNPTNVMGTTKRLCELFVQSLSHRKDISTQFVITRFGNVLGSNGSVIPLFRKQIESGGPVTVTHPDITRFFMTIPEACQLVLEAAFMGQGGEIFVFDMGEQIKIYDLATQMIKLSGFVPDKDIKIDITGLRPGEKLYKELLSFNEITLPTHHPKIMIARNGVPENHLLESQINDLLSSLYDLSHEEVLTSLREMVPEFSGAETEG